MADYLPVEEERIWIDFIKQQLHDSKSGRLPCPSIFMVSSPLRGLKLHAFIPQVVAIGPYHSDLGPHHSCFPDNQEAERYKAIAAKEMQKHKIMASRHVAKTFQSGDFCSLAKEIEKEADRVRNEYDTELACKLDEKLAYMLALDVSFIVEVLRSTLDPDCRSGFNAYYCSRFPRPLRKSILEDFVLLENQVPLFLLLKVIRMDLNCDSDAKAEQMLGSLVAKVAHELLPFYMLSEDSYAALFRDIGTRKHLLDCLYYVVTHGSAAAANTNLVEKPTHFPRAEELHQCGVSFKAVEPGNMTSVKFDYRKAILYVPRIRVGDDTERLFRNLIAYESHLVNNVGVLSYLRFMNSLVDSPEDVALLVRKGIIAQDIGSNDEVADIWNKLCANTMRVCSEEYEQVAQDLLKHCQVKTNALKAEFKRIYLSKPWLVVSVISAAALLVMTLVIMYYTIKLFYKHGG